MTDKLLSAISEYEMLLPGDTVTVAVSGGADSMCLLHILKSHEAKLDITVNAAHLNHCLRGEESDRDEAFVRDYCQKYEIPLTVERLDVNSLRKKGEGLEEAARRIRYDFLKRAAPQGKIATAHTLSDCAETVILNIARGTALGGLCGILPKRENIIRPLIRFTRDMTEEYCRKNNIDYVTDSTNLTDFCRRNSVRHNIIPLLCEFNPAFFDSIQRLTETSLSEDEYLTAVTNELLQKARINGGYDCSVLQSSPRAIRRRAIKQILVQNKACAEYRHIIALERVILEGSSVQINPEISFRKRRGVLESFTAFTKQELCQPLSENVTFGEKRFVLEKISAEKYSKQLKVNKMLAKQAVDFDKILEDAVLRSKKEGDKIKLLNRPTKTLKKLFNEYGVLPQERSQLAVLADSESVRWLEGFGADASAEVTPDTSTVLIISMSKGDNNEQKS